MKPINSLRLILIGLTTLIFLITALLMFQFTDIAFRVWDRLQNTSPMFLTLYAIMLAALAAVGLFLIAQLWSLGRSKTSTAPVNKLKNAEELRLAIEAAKERGVDVGRAEAQMQHFNPDPAATLTIAFFGRISSGKSSLIQSLLPNASVEISIIGGSTQRIERYDYCSAEGLQVVLLDMPGTQHIDQDESLRRDISDSARRAHIVLYVLDQDLTASDQEAIDMLRSYDKPIILVLNKMDWYSDEERSQLRQHIHHRLPDLPLVMVQSAVEKSLTRRDASGAVSTVIRKQAPQLQELLKAITQITAAHNDLKQRQQQAVLCLADEALHIDQQDWRLQRGQALIKAYAHKAMLGGVAAVGPGADVVIQGYLGIGMLRALCSLYDVSVKDVDLQKFVDEASDKVKNHLTVILALAGNVFKAFPGLGTVVGGAAHAVAYGIIFESLGNAVLQTLSQHQELGEHLMNQFEETLRDDLEQHAKNLAKGIIRRGYL